MRIPIFPDALVSAVMGYIVVFLGLCLLMGVVTLLGKFMNSQTAAVSSPAPAAPAAPAVPAPAPVVEPEAPRIPPAPGSAGEVKLFDVPDRQAAMIMAIVANKMGRPLNELRFKSIKEIKTKE